MRKLRARWRDAKWGERVGLKQLYEKKYRDQLRKERRMKREKNYGSFVNNLY